MQQEVEREMNGSQRKEKLLRTIRSQLSPQPPPHPLTHTLAYTRARAHSLTPLPSAFQSSYKEIKDERLRSANTSKGGGVTGSASGAGGGGGPAVEGRGS